MPARFTPLVVNQVYHIYNRGVARQPIYINKRDYERFLLTLSYYRFPAPLVKLSRLLQLPIAERERLLKEIDKKKEKLVEIISYVLMPNHFHLLIKQTGDNGISTFLRKSINSYTRYLNTKRSRVGPLFQGAFKAVRVEDDEQLLHLSRYIHLNPLVSFVVKESEFRNYPWSSFADYLKGQSNFLDVNIVLSHFASSKSYEKFIFDQADYAKQLEKIKHLILEI